MRYDREDWMRRGATYLEDFRGGRAYRAQEQALMAALAPLEFSTVLEFGCGFGRITKLIHEARRPAMYVATDVVPEMLSSAERYVGPGVTFVWDDLDEGVLRGPADLVVCVEVLMHRTLEQVEQDVVTLCHASARYVITADWHGDIERPEAEGCYQHDYAALFAPYGAVTVLPVPDARQAVFVIDVTRRGDGQDQ